MLHKLITYLIYSYVIFVPLIYLKASKSVFSMPKLTFVRLVTIVILLLYTYLILRKKKVNFLTNKFNILLLIYSFVSVLTTIFSSYFFASIIGTQGRFVGIVTLLNFLFISYIAFQHLQQAEIKRITIYSIMVATFLAIWGIFQHYGIFVGEYWSADPKERAFATLEHGNHYGAYLGFNLILLMSLVLESGKKKHLILGLLAALTFISAIIFTGSRAAILTLTVSIIVFTFLYFIFANQSLKNSFHKISKKLIFTSISLLIITAIIIWFSPLKNIIAQTILFKRTQETINFIKSGNIPDRASWILSAISMFKDRPILGHGLSTYKDVYNRYRRTDFRNPHGSQDVITPEHAHNEYFNKLAEQGMIGLFTYLLLIGYPLFIGLNYLKKNTHPKKLIIIGYLTALISYLFQVLFNFGVITTLTLFHVFLGVLVKLTYPENIKPRELKLNFSKSSLLVIMSLTIIFGLSTLTIKQMQAEIYYRETEIAFKEKNIDAMIYFGDRMVTIMPWEYVYFSALGDFLYQIAADEQNYSLALVYLKNAAQAYQAALNIQPQMPYLHANLGLIYYLYGKTLQDMNEIRDSLEANQAAIEAYKKAVIYSPNNPLYPYNLGYILLELGRPKEAIPYYQTTLTYRKDYPSAAYNLAASYFQIGNYQSSITILKQEEKEGRGGPRNNKLWQMAEEALKDHSFLLLDKALHAATLAQPYILARWNFIKTNVPISRCFINQFQIFGKL